MNAKTDIWMPVVIGDYLKDTQHLNATEHGCYFLWLMHYWVRGPLPSSIDKLIAIGRLVGPDASSIAQALLGEFFTLNGDGMYHQGRADKEKERWQGKRLQAKGKAEKAAAARWKKHASSNAPSNASSTPQAMLELCPSSSPSSSHKEQIHKASPSSPNGHDPDHVRLQVFPDLWNQLCENLPKVEKFTDSRKRKVRARIAQGISSEKFIEAVKACTMKPFLRGENDRGWTATFDWLIENDLNIEKAITNPYGMEIAFRPKHNPTAGMKFINVKEN